MNISNTYLFFPATPENESFYESFANIMANGNPINDLGDDIESDGFIYQHRGNDEYVKI